MCVLPKLMIIKNPDPMLINHHKICKKEQREFWPHKESYKARLILFYSVCSLWPVPDVPDVSDMWLLIISASPTVFQPPALAPTPGTRAPAPGLWTLRQPPRAQNRQCCFNQLVDICRDIGCELWPGVKLYHLRVLSCFRNNIKDTCHVILYIGFNWLTL